MSPCRVLRAAGLRTRGRAFVGPATSSARPSPSTRLSSIVRLCACSTIGRRAISRPGSTSRSVRSCPRTLPPPCRPGWSRSRRWRRLDGLTRPRGAGAVGLSGCTGGARNGRHRHRARGVARRATACARRDPGTSPVAQQRSRDAWWTVGADGRPSQVEWLQPEGRRSVRQRDPVAGPRLEEAGITVGVDRQAASSQSGCPAGEMRTFLEDGDRVTLRGWCERPGFVRIGFGEVTGTVLPAPTGMRAA